MSKKDKLVTEIAESIQNHRLKELDKYIINPAIGLANVHFANSKQKFWLTNKPNLGGFRTITDLVGNVQTVPGLQSTLTDDGPPIYKNSPFGECLIRNSSGKHILKIEQGIREIEIFNTSFYTPHPTIAEAIDVRMNIGEQKPRLFRSLMEFLGQIKTDIDEIERIEEQIETSEIEDQQLIDRLELLKKSKNDSLSKAKSFIRRNYELRYQPILDPWQEEVKRSNLFNNPVAINGGPGTGKTTSLIQRIKFLTDEEALKDYLPQLTKNQSEKIFDKNQGWVFFSPSELLKLFLKNSMISEGLSADDNHVQTWDSFKQNLMSSYKIISKDSPSPFLFLSNKKYKSEILIPSGGYELKKVIDDFDKFYLDFQQERLSKLTDLDCSKFFWKNKANSIQKYIKRFENDNSIEGLIRLYFNLKEEFSLELNDITTDYNQILKKGTASILNALNKENSVKNEAVAFVERWKENSIDEENDENLDDINEEDENDLQELELYLFEKIKTIIRKDSLSKFDRVTKLTSREKELKSIIEKSFLIHSLNNYDRIGQLAYFIKYFGRLTRGVVNNLIIDIPKLYKLFRRSELSSKSNKWNFEILEKIISDEIKNKRLHPNEQAFLIYFINKLIKGVYKNSKSQFEEINHIYFDGFKSNCRAVIGVDEATDFHIIDLLAIDSMSDPEISSVTYSGDLMQRLTSDGIKDWKELRLFKSNLEIKDLIISYRQSPTLLKIAQSIYNNATGKNADYMSFMDEDEIEPKPLFYADQDEVTKLDWISKRIIEIYKSYSNTIPSIAIFLSSEDKLESFAENLSEIDRLADVGINVLACKDGRVLGDSNTVRVFSVEFIKGLEFEAVFYHNINEIFDQKNGELVMKNLYVGLSRASFYLGITSDNAIKDMPFIEPYFNEMHSNWQ